MDSLNSVLNLVQKGDWAISLDLKDAYFLIPIHETHKKYLRFCVNNMCYQFRVLCFGPTSAPRIFTKVCSVVAAHLRAQNICLAAYLDDWFLINQAKQMLISDREKTLNLLTNLGFVVNLEKSSLISTQSITYIGAVFSLKEVIVRPTSESVSKLLSAVEFILNKQNQATARDFLQLLGIMASCIELFPNETNSVTPPLSLKTSMSKSRNKNSFSNHLKGHFRWWLNIENLVMGRSITLWETSITVTTDASKSGYGGHINNSLIVQGSWSVEEKLLHINSLEIEAVFLTVKHFLPKLIGKNVLIRSENATVVRYINKQGGTRSPQPCMRTWKLWQLALENQIFLKAAHIAGKKNILADHLSRVKIQPTKWSLNKEVTHAMFQIWETPHIDLFASAKNRQTQIYCSWNPDPQAYAIDALTILWNIMYAYAYPPICLIPKILQNMTRRCSDLQSLCIGEESIVVQKKGVTFVRHGLSKQDRPKHFGSKIFIPSYQSDKLLDPKRNSDSEFENKLFLSFIEPHKPVTSQTISFWIANAIKYAYNKKDKKCRAHSTRALGPSWALFNGASVKSIMDTADWSKESTFTRFYLRHIDVEVLNSV
ncbi:unnamed protein product [Mytilus coruscus]|uniref:Reverse transcriptase domain-containing protein n=1 Tax=Mytilus coruscus TaxID=42192 RepID=A0A6J8CM03_MYTCO|nr:unnamed protein product [Mytilus coruscus]